MLPFASYSYSTVWSAPSASAPQLGEPLDSYMYLVHGLSVVITVGGDDFPIMINDPGQPSECVILIINRIVIRQLLGLDSDKGLVGVGRYLIVTH